MRVIILSLLLTGCADSMVLRHPVDTVTITWVDRRCGASEGCALPMGDKCYMAAPKSASPDLIAHELLHCVGFEHAN